MTSNVLRQDDGGVTTLTLDRPAQFNAMSEDCLLYTSRCV